MNSLKLVRFKEFSVTELAPQLFEAVSSSKQELLKRYSPGTVRRLGTSVALALEMTERAIKQDCESDLNKNGRATFAVATAPESVMKEPHAVGIGTIISGLKMYIQHVPIKPKYVDKFGYHRVRTEALYGHANVTGWTTAEYTTDLDEVYKGLTTKIPDLYQSWTIEPKNASAFVHTAIQSSGMIAIGKPERYDIGEDRNIAIPISQAYGHPADIQKG